MQFLASLIVSDLTQLGYLRLTTICLLRLENGLHHISKYLELPPVHNINQFIEAFEQKYFTAKKPYTNINQVLKLGAIIGNEHDISFALQYGADNISSSTYSATRNGHINIVKLLLALLNDNFIRLITINLAILIAAECDHVNIVDLLIEEGATDLNEALEKAAGYGRMNVVNLLMEKAGYTLIRKGSTAVNRAILLADQNEHFDIANFIRTKRNNLVKREGILILSTLIGILLIICAIGHLYQWLQTL